MRVGFGELVLAIRLTSQVANVNFHHGVGLDPLEFASLGLCEGVIADVLK